MRKYFLLAAAALMISGTANAEDIAGTIEVNATIKNVTKISCTSLDFGEILLPVNNVESTVRIPADAWVAALEPETLTTGDAIVSSLKSANCGVVSSLTFDEETSAPNNIQLPVLALLKSSGGSSLLLGNFEAYAEPEDDFLGSAELNIGATLSIPANAPAGKYTGSFPIIITVE